MEKKNLRLYYFLFGLIVGTLLSAVVNVFAQTSILLYTEHVPYEKICKGMITVETYDDRIIYKGDDNLDLNETYFIDRFVSSSTDIKR